MIGIIAKRSGFWGREHQISTEANPTLNYPIGEKEILSYDTSILGLENMIEVDKKLGINTERLDKSISMLKRMRSKAVDPFKESPSTRKEKEEEKRLREWSRDSAFASPLLFQRIKPHSVFIDMGASIGDTSFVAAALPNVEEVYAFEAIPFTFEEGLRNLGKQPWEVRRKIHYSI